MKLVLDTSVLAKLFIAEWDRPLAVKVLADTIAAKVPVLAPSLVLYELNSVFVKNGMVGQEYDNAIRETMRMIGANNLVIREPTEGLLREAARIASLDTHGQGHISSFDATFHALALQEGATFLTADAAYVRKAKALVGRVMLLSEYTP